MALVSFGSAYNMASSQTWYGNITAATPTQLVISNGFSTGVYEGSFSYSDQSVFGTLSTYTQYSGSVVVVRVEGLSLNANTVQGFVQNNQQPALFELGLRGNDVVLGSAGADVLYGYSGRDRIGGGGGNDAIDGGTGVDIAGFIGVKAQYNISRLGSTIVVQDTVAGRDGTDTLLNVERLLFSDVHLAFDLAADQAYRIYQAAFARTPDVAGLSYWVRKMDEGMSLRDVAYGFVQSAEFKAAYGTNPSPVQLVEKLYQNVLGRPAEKAGVDYWSGLLASGTNVIDVVAGISESAENISRLAPITAQGVVLDYNTFL